MKKILFGFLLLMMVIVSGLVMADTTVIPDICTKDGGSCDSSIMDGDFDTIYETSGEEIIKTYILAPENLETLRYGLKFRRDGSSDIYIKWYNFTSDSWQNFPGNCEGYSLPLGGTDPYWHCNGVYTSTWELNIADAVDTDGSIKFYYHPWNSGNSGYYESEIEFTYSCVPNWECISYTQCDQFRQSCNEVNDTNQCGEYYGGNFSEFPVEICGTTSSPSRSSQNVINPNSQLYQQSSDGQQGTTFSLVEGEKFNLGAWLESIIMNIRRFFGLKG